MNGGQEQWSNVAPYYASYVGNTGDRNSVAVGENGVYLETSGRNDIIGAQVARDEEYIYFNVECSENITSYQDKLWMNLYIDSDQYYYTGWAGFDFVINRSHGDGKVSVERFVDNSWKFESVGEAEYTLNGKELIIKVNSSLVALDERDNFDFKWADNSTVNGEIMEFMDLGDTAPNSRFNFRYVKENGKGIFLKKL